MRDNSKRPELLAPGGSPEALEAALKAGADAVYFGGKLFNARMNARNFDDSAMASAIEKCHKRGARAYVTLNTQIYDRELEDALKYSAFLYECGADALIMADPGLASLVREYLPSMELHASTQASGHSSDCAKKLASLGFTRMVCAREISEEDLSLLIASSPIETELFVHGAMCVCHSGQCLMSSVIGGRSGNRGECAQPCRMRYNNAYPLSLKDMALGSHIKELSEMGVASFKIEGRMKSPDYVYSVVSLYRRLIDENRNADRKELEALANVFSRSGFTDGYFTGKISDKMLGIRSEQDKNNTKNAHTFHKDLGIKREEIKHERKKAELPPKILSSKKGEPSNRVSSARFVSPSQIPSAHGFDIVYLPLDRFDGKLANGVILPPVIFDKEIPKTRKDLLEAERKGAKHVLVGNIGHLSMLEGTSLIPHGDLRLNIFNSKDIEVLKEFEDLTVSVELTLPQIRDLPAKKSAVVYGRLPIMLLEKPVGASRLRDRTGASFDIIKENGRDVLYNSVPVYMADKKDSLKKSGIFNTHFIFSTESKKECENIIDAYKKGIPYPGNGIRRIK
ncbi:MAG: U32 family peptidase [Ruminococcaceae bacterium]|nr:U32 family peptidase [Oscillospiraceae bacterium]